MTNRLPPAWTKHVKPGSRPAPQGRAGPSQADLTALLKSGVGLQQQKQFLEAERLYQKVLALDPDNAEANHLMGTLALEARDRDLAIEFFEKAVKGKPKDPFFHYNLGNAYLEAGGFEDALKHLRRAVDLKPNLVEALCGLGRAYVRMNQAKTALPFYEKALAMDASHPQVGAGLANALINLGRMDEAITYLDAVISQRSAVASAYGNLVATRKFAGDPPELQAILRELATPGLAPDDSSQLHHAAGKILNDLKCHSEAMEHFQSAKIISGRHFDIVTYRKWIDEIMALFSPATMMEKRDCGDASTLPVFIVGMPRSGTTLTEQIMSSHPQVHGAGELYKLRKVASSVGYNGRVLRPFAESVMAMTAGTSLRLAGDYLGHLRRHSREALRIVDKMPHNFELIGLIALLFPKARIIHCRREPLDNCVSCFTNEFSGAHGYNADLKNLGLYYREYDRLMRHWNKLLQGRIYESHYEDLVAHQERESRKLIACLDLPWDDACLRFHESERTVNTISRWQVRQPIYASSVQRWKNYESKLQPLIAALGDLAGV
jgi:tetratricopeptide (TPR) repeat protein